MGETQETKDELRKLSFVTIPRLLLAIVLAISGFLVGTFIVTIEPIGTTQRIAVWIFFPSVIFVMTTIASTVGYLLFEGTNAMGIVQAIHKSDVTRMSQMPIMRRFILRDAIR